jgi:dihydrofolate synthase/folylpolyglutamate synthase
VTSGDDPAGLAALARVEKALEDRTPTRMVPDLDRISDLLDLLGSPQRAYPSIHLTGTNGKTSTARMIDSLLRGFGMRTGRYTSPHLERVSERIALDGVPLSAERFAAVYDEVAPLVDLVDTRHPDRMTFFEVLTAMAFAAFADAPVGAAVVEVGLGGRWDATNRIEAPVAVITSIGLDHVGILGSTVAEIAAEKAGIITPGAVCVSSPQPPEALAVIEARVADVGATLILAGRDVGLRSRVLAVGGQHLALAGLGGDYDDILLPLHGVHQAGNALAALVAVEAFFGLSVGDTRGPIDVETVREAFANVSSPGRLEVVRRGPTVIIDGAHNPAGAAAVAAALSEEFAFDRCIGVLAVLGDKDAEGILSALEPVVAAVVCSTNSSPRAMPADELAGVAREVFGDDRVEVEVRLDDALEVAIELAEAGTEGMAGTGVIVTGSIVTAGEARTLLRPGAR